MAVGTTDKAAIMAGLPVRPGEDPFVVAMGGFYRRWFNLLEDLRPLMDTVAVLKGTEDEEWVPAWSAVAARHEAEAEAALRGGDQDGARRAFLQAKSYYSIARFPCPYHSGSAFCPAEMGPLKRPAYEKYLETYRRAAEFLDPPQETLRVARDGREAVGYLRLPPGASSAARVPAVLIMCGGDMYKEDRQHYAEGALAQGLAAFVVDAPGTGQTTFPHAPESIVAWQAALDALSLRPEIDAARLGAFGVSRGGLWVMRLAALDPRVKALISIAPAGVGYWGTPEERAAWRKVLDDRARHWFGPRGAQPPPRPITEDEQRAEFLRWSLKDNGLLQEIQIPMLLINGKQDHLSPIGNLYLALESGPPTGRVARVYPDDGHIAAKNERQWGPAAWRWLRGELAGRTEHRGSVRDGGRRAARFR